MTFFMAFSFVVIADDNYDYVISSLYNENIPTSKNESGNCFYDDYNYFLVIENKASKQFKDVLFWDNVSVKNSNRKLDSLKSYILNGYKYSADNLIETIDKETSFYHYYSICRNDLKK